MFSLMYGVASYLKLYLRSKGVSIPVIDKSDHGQGMVEYALILALVAVVVIAALTLLGPQVSSALIRVECKFDPNIHIVIYGSGTPTTCQDLGLD